MAIALAIFLCFACGYLIVALLWPPSSRTSSLALRASLSFGYGLGIFSAIYFLAKVFSLPVIATDFVVSIAIGAACFLRRTRHAVTRCEPANDDVALPNWLGLLLKAAFALSLGSAIYSAVMRAIAHPHGDGWDAFAIWNLHARFFFRSGNQWSDGLSPLIPWSHPDYPPLLPAVIAHFWTYAGHETPAVPAFIGLAFAFSTLAVLYFSLVRLSGHNTARLGFITLATTPFFIEQGASQYADVPLSFFFLASVALLSLHDQPYRNAAARGFLVLAGLAIGFAAWTKNEGSLFLFATFGAFLIFFIRSRRRKVPAEESQSRLTAWSTPATLLLGMAPVLVLILWFKHLAPRGDLFPEQAIMLQKVLTPARYWAIVKWHAKEYLRFGGWWPIPATLLLPALYFAAGRRKIDAPRPWVFVAVWTLAITLAGYFAIYVITPNELYWHLRFSLNRLFLQLWPSAVYLFFSSVSFRFVRNVSK
jgi:hypothetical protein